MFNDTVAKLASITDAAQFERIATAVLRAAKPSLYSNLSQPGVNTDGKTVKAPLDSVGWVQAGEVSTFVAVAHTTAAQKDLDGKWLHDPSAVNARKKGGRPTQPAGDLVKAIEEIKKLRQQYPNLKAALALTSNREEPVGVRVNAEALAHANDVDLDVWSASRLSQFLDTVPDGQAIRFEFLGVEPTRLSIQELLRIGRQSLAEQLMAIDDAAIVDRNSTFSGHTLLSGTSGMGKTIICRGILSRALQRNQPGVVLEDQTLMRSATLEEALDIELRRYSPSLEPGSGVRALEFCSEAEPLIVIVEDINRAQNPERLLNKVINWALKKEVGAVGSRWSLICPVWPHFLASIDKKKEMFEAGMVRPIGLFTEEEAREAVKRRRVLLGLQVDDLAASAIAGELGNDPLLIGLHDRAAPPSHDVIGEYIDDELGRAARTALFTKTDLEDAVLALGLQILEHGNLQPTWREIDSWIGNGAHLAAIRAIVLNARLLFLSGSSRGEVLHARHDRVLYHLLASSVRQQLATSVDAAFLSDPYFAEIVGMAASAAGLPLDRLQATMDGSPLVAFYALKHSVASKSDYAAIAATAIKLWINTERHRDSTFWSRRYWGLMVLAEIDSEIVTSLTPLFTAKSDLRQPLFAARFRNGDLNAGFMWLIEYPLEVSIQGRQELIDHVQRKYGRGFVAKVGETLKTPGLSAQQRRGALLLAGYIADPSLAVAVQEAWRRADGDRDLEAFLWAAARVCGDDAETTLGPVCDAWEALPDAKDNSGGSQRSRLAAHGIAWKFRDHVPTSAIPYFVERAKRSKELSWPITYMLRSVDDPNAVQHEAEYQAELSRMGGRGGFVDYFLKDEWHRLSKEMGKRMSPESKQRLLDISSDQSNDEHLRKEAFTLWEVSVAPNDVNIAKQIDPSDIRYNKAVWARARRRDLTVMPGLLEKIVENPRYWWQAARYIWADELVGSLGRTIGEIANSDEEERESKGSWIVPEIILRLDPETGESLLLPWWDNIRHIPEFLQVALCLATPTLLELVRAAVADAPNPRSLFEHFSHRAGINYHDRDGLTRLHQIQALQPYFQLFSDFDLAGVWEACVKNGWLDYARENLEPVLRSLDSDYVRRLLDKREIDVSGLESALEDSRAWTTYHWLEDRLRGGTRREEALDALFGWCRDKASVRALEIVGDILSLDGSRKEFAQLKRSVPILSGGDEILDQIQFNIFRRTLS
jgi:hypothetical protein